MKEKVYGSELNLKENLKEIYRKNEDYKNNLIRVEENG